MIPGSIQPDTLPMSYVRGFAAGLILTFSSLSVAVADDIAGSEDHPLITRYPGTEIAAYQASEFRDFRVATGPLAESEERDAMPPLLEGEGKVTSITYHAEDESVSALQIFRNFQSAFADAGFREIYSCDSEKECGDGFVVQMYWYGDVSRQVDHGFLDAPNRRGSSARFFYWSGRTGAAEDSAIVSLLVAQDVSQAFQAVVVLDINEPEAMELGKVGIDLEGLDREIRNSGRAVLNGILFDNDKATLKQESADTVAVVADFLKKNPAMSFYVVGHTDNTGDYEYNRGLSESRAKTVTETLVGQHGISADRLTAVGIGPVSPATANGTDSGRSANRRVELVQR